MEENNPLVSIIVPVYNTRPYLESAVNSVIHQSYQNLDIILVNDGATDGSGELCEKISRQDKRIRTIHQRNQGLGRARNVALEYKGRYSCFLGF